VRNTIILAGAMCAVVLGCDSNREDPWEAYRRAVKDLEEKQAVLDELEKDAADEGKLRQYAMEQQQKEERILRDAKGQDSPPIRELDDEGMVEVAMGLSKEEAVKNSQKRLREKDLEARVERIRSQLTIRIAEQQRRVAEAQQAVDRAERRLP
jgi:hypothetical protein